MAKKIDDDDDDDYFDGTDEATDSIEDVELDLGKYSGQLDARRRLEQLKEERELERLINSNIYDDFY